MLGSWEVFLGVSSWEGLSYIFDDLLYDYFRHGRAFRNRSHWLRGILRLGVGHGVELQIRAGQTRAGKINEREET